MASLATHAAIVILEYRKESVESDRNDGQKREIGYAKPLLTSKHCCDGSLRSANNEQNTTTHSAGQHSSVTDERIHSFNYYSHSNSSVLDFLHAQALEVLSGNTTFLLGESKRIISVVTRDFSSLGPLAVVGDAFEPSGNQEDLEPSGVRDHVDSIQRSGLGNILEGNTRGGGDHPVGGGRFGAEGVRSRRSEVEREVNSEFLDPESDGGNHGNTSVLNFGVLEPLDSVRTSIFQNLAAKRGDLVSGFDANSEGFIDSSVQGSRARVYGGGGKGRSRCKKKGKCGKSLHGVMVYNCNVIAKEGDRSPASQLRITVADRLIRTRNSMQDGVESSFFCACFSVSSAYCCTFQKPIFILT